MKFTFVYTFFISVILFSACGKKPVTPAPTPEPTVNTELSNGFTENPKKLAGYFYLSANTQTNNSNNSIMAYLTGFATFSDPPRNLIKGFDHVNDMRNFNSNDIGNVSVGEVTYNGSLLSMQTFSPVNVSYFLNSTNPLFNYTARWSIEGNGAFKAIDQVLPRGFPIILHSALTQTVSRSKDLVLDLTKFISNYDSVLITIEGSFSQRIKKSVALPETMVTFKSAELGMAFNSQNYGSIEYMAYNYANRTVESKVYVFELSTKVHTQVQIFP